MPIEETFPNLPQPVEVQSLKRGGIYALVFERGLAERSAQLIKESVDRAAKELGVKFLILDGGVRIVSVTRAEAKDIERVEKKK